VPSKRMDAEKMQTKTPSRQLPSMILSMTDYERLANLASMVADRIPDGSDALLSKLERAIVLADGSMALGCRAHGFDRRIRDRWRRYVGDGSHLTRRCLHSSRNVSVLTPIGAALLGLSTEIVDRLDGV
jgi:hypothetical protein